MIASKAVFLTFLAPLIATLTMARGQTDRVPRAWGEPVDGLQISLYLASGKIDRLGIPDVALAIRNLGLDMRKVALGGGCAGAGPVPGSKTSHVRLFLTDEAGQSQELEDRPGPPLIGGCAGAGWIFTVDVPGGGTSSVPIDLDCYYVQESMFVYAWAGGGTYLLRAELPLRQPPGPPTVQTVESNELALRFPAGAASQRCFSNGLQINCKGVY